LSRSCFTIAAEISIVVIPVFYLLSSGSDSYKESAGSQAGA
jgi:hypothetical protein